MEKKTLFTRKNFIQLSGIAAAGIFLQKLGGNIVNYFSPKVDVPKVKINPHAVKRENRGDN